MLKYLFENQEYVIISPHWVVNFPTLIIFYMSSLGGGGGVLKEFWSMSLNNPFYLKSSLIYLRTSLNLIVSSTLANFAWLSKLLIIALSLVHLNKTITTHLNNKLLFMFFSDEFMTRKDLFQNKLPICCARTTCLGWLDGLF